MKNNRRTIKMRKTAPRDVERFWNLFETSVKEQFQEYPVKARKFFLEKYYSKKILKQWIKDGTITLLFAINNNEIVGYLMANEPYGGVSFIAWIAIQDAFQSKGIGSALLKEYEAIAKKQGVHKVFLAVTNKKNFEFYKKHKYKVAGYIPQSYFGVNEWRLYKKLQDPKY